MTINRWDVRVWFATASDFRTVSRNMNGLDALTEARGYVSDAKGVYIVNNVTNETAWLKRPAGMES